eukprot:GHRQ01027349.1.p1 GENE.GHRQ01027349.1~~GHRQ01027349.1.p1  ORF type:complete len:147 (-),score=1.59 GHRQ01027349.1:8-448(-)
MHLEPHVIRIRYYLVSATAPPHRQPWLFRQAVCCGSIYAVHFSRSVSICQCQCHTFCVHPHSANAPATSVSLIPASALLPWPGWLVIGWHRQRLMVSGRLPSYVAFATSALALPRMMTPCGGTPPFLGRTSWSNMAVGMAKGATAR